MDSVCNFIGSRCSASKEYIYMPIWVPVVYIPLVTAAIQYGNSPSSSGMLEKVEPPEGTPPTFIPTCKYTECLQAVVDKYGIAR